MVSSVFVEEMLHLALAANLLNAVGGRPRLDTPTDAAAASPAPASRRPLPGAVLVPFGPEALEMFLRMETAGAARRPGGGRRLRDDRAVLRRDRTRAAPSVRRARRAGGLLRRPGPSGHGRPLPAHRRAADRRHRPRLGAGGARGDRRAGRGHRPRRGLGRRPGHLPPRARRGRPLLPLRGARSWAGATGAATPRSPAPPARRSRSTRTASSRCGPTRA